MGNLTKPVVQCFEAELIGRLVDNLVTSSRRNAASAEAAMRNGMPRLLANSRISHIRFSHEINPLIDPMAVLAVCDHE